MTIKDIFTRKKEEEITTKGWVVSNRGNNKIRFLVINDGSTFKNLQIVIKNQAEEIDKARMGSAILAKGILKLTPGGKQEAELVAENVEILKNTDEDYPLQKQGMSMEFLREIPHLRHRTNLFRAVMRIRSTLTQEIHDYFRNNNFLNVSSPIITSNDGEGAGEAFVVDDEGEGEFFGKKATLGVTGQLQAESYANGFGDVYTFAPTFRAENSNTKKHAAEFWMIEPEMAFKGIDDGIALADDLLKKVISKTIEKHPEEFAFLENHVDSTLIKRLKDFISTGVKKITYSDAIEKLKKVSDIFEEKNIEFGLDLATEHEKYLAKEIFKGPVAVTNYPKDIKAFYMKQNDDGKTVAAFDILVPGIGELAGGSERETDYEKIENRVRELGLDQKELQWYLDLRRFGQFMSVGFGLGFERLVMYVTGVENIRDSIPFPRTPRNLKM
ncbi:MAG: asparagine--tRNA ligase [Mycoplasmatales bacterium]|nr:asparagine--tRNA ligase [Mycoplasmatales bacterium]